MLLARATWALLRSNVGLKTPIRLSSRYITSQRAKGNILDTLASRSLLAQVTAPNSLRKHLEGQVERTVYVGVDPSADSLHVGNLLPLLAALHFLEHGHKVIVLIGGATGSIGDPSGRDTERTALSVSELEHNIACVTAQVEEFFSRAGSFLKAKGKKVDDESKEIGLTPLQHAAEMTSLPKAEEAAKEAMENESSGPGDRPYAAKVSDVDDLPLAVTVVNNAVWYQGLNVLTFLREVGKFARIGKMLGRDSVKSRLEPTNIDAPSKSSGGLSYTEFSYQLLQAYDFSILNRPPWNCTVQLGGSDQMGNIMAGVDLIRRQKLQRNLNDGEEESDTDDTPAYGLTLPLLTTASGAKFGKSAGNAIWLSPTKCSDYDLYQFLYRSRDDEVELYLKTLTMLPLDEIETIMRNHRKEPSARLAQTTLAAQVTELIRGKEAVSRAKTATRVLFDADLAGLNANEVTSAFQQDQRLIHLEKSAVMGASVLSLAVDSGLVASKTEARRVLTGGGLYLNNRAVQDVSHTISGLDAICQGKIIILRKGRAEHRIIALTS